jgi:hypothetical protein
MATNPATERCRLLPIMATRADMRLGAVVRGRARTRAEEDEQVKSSMFRR